MILALALLSQIVPVQPAFSPLSPASSNNYPAHYRGTRITGAQSGFPEKIIALTFDDGPDPKLTLKLLQILRQNNAKATFFVVGSNANAYPKVIRQIVQEGHAIANHSYTHPSKTSKDRAISELGKTQAAIKRAVGFSPTLFRPPYGITNGQLGIQAKAQKFSTILWSTDTLDWKYRKSETVIKRATSNKLPGGIVLMHDIHPSTVNAIPGVIKAYAKAGYRFVTVPELLTAWDAYFSTHKTAKRPPLPKWPF